MRSHHLFAAALQSHAEKQAIELPVAYNVADMKTVDSLGQPSWKFASDRVEAWITRLGGHLGPVNFRVGDRVVSPFSVAPWAEEDIGPGFLPICGRCVEIFFVRLSAGTKNPIAAKRILTMAPSAAPPEPILPLHRASTQLLDAGIREQVLIHFPEGGTALGRDGIFHRAGALRRLERF